MAPIVGGAVLVRGVAASLYDRTPLTLVGLCCRRRLVILVLCLRTATGKRRSSEAEVLRPGTCCQSAGVHLALAWRAPPPHPPAHRVCFRLASQ